MDWLWANQQAVRVTTENGLWSVVVKQNQNAGVRALFYLDQAVFHPDRETVQGAGRRGVKHLALPALEALKQNGLGCVLPCSFSRPRLPFPHVSPALSLTNGLSGQALRTCLKTVAIGSSFGGEAHSYVSDDEHRTAKIGRATGFQAGSQCIVVDCSNLVNSGTGSGRPNRNPCA